MHTFFLSCSSSLFGYLKIISVNRSILLCLIFIILFSQRHASAALLFASAESALLDEAAMRQTSGAHPAVGVAVYYQTALFGFGVESAINEADFRASPQSLDTPVLHFL